MIRWITPSDFEDLYLQTKWSFFKVIPRTLRLTGRGRTFSRWNNHVNLVINWYDLPSVVRYVQQNLTGDGNTPYAGYLLEKFFPGKREIRILSPGCGAGVKEFQFARHPSVARIDGFDIAPARIDAANTRAAGMGLHNARFFVGDMYDLKVEAEYDLILFDSCLHHFDNLDALMDKILGYLKPDGLLVIVEFTGPNRYQFTERHVAKCNEALKLIPLSHRTFLRSSLVKKRIWAPGYLRMVMSDPSEGIRSGEILPVIHRKFDTLEEKKLGGDLLAPVLKGLVHHFMGNEASQPILDRLYAFEREYLETVPAANYTFGVYSPKAKVALQTRSLESALPEPATGAVAR